MKTLRDYRCDSCGLIIERYIEPDVLEIECDCGEKAQRMIGMPRIALEGITGDFPSAADKWANVREQRHKLNGKKSYVKP